MSERTRLTDSAKGSVSRICEPMCTLTPAGVDALELRGAAIDLAGALDGDAELVLAQAGGDVGVRFGEDVRVDAQRDAGLLAQGLGAFGEEFEFGFALDVEEEDVGVEGGVHLPGLLADAGEDDA